MKYYVMGERTRRGSDNRLHPAQCVVSIESDTNYTETLMYIDLSHAAEKQVT